LENQGTFEELKKLNKQIVAQINLERVLLETFNNCPYPCWIKILGHYMLVNTAFLSPESRIYRSTGELRRNYVITERDKIVMETLETLKVTDALSSLEGEAYIWSGYKFPIIHQGKLVGIGGLVESWKTI